ncbi:MAG: hypothetical protein IT211_05875 [Armatimonadetes bacterium]|nr:hypothetical protein [Armatimonadota bacterium]
MARRVKQTKYITLANMCELCANPTKFELLGEAAGQEEGKRWAKCSKCHHTMMIDMLVVEGEKRSTKKEVTVAVEDCVPYSPRQIYTVGDAIYHKTWDDVGTVISKELTSKGGQAIVVSFNKVGEKRLIENLV